MTSTTSVEGPAACSSRHTDIDFTATPIDNAADTVARKSAHALRPDNRCPTACFVHCAELWWPASDVGQMDADEESTPHADPGIDALGL